MRRRFGNVRGANTAALLLEHALATSTRYQYDRHFLNFASYCEEEGLSACPATPTTVITYVGCLADEGTWAEESMQPIFSGINAAHKDMGMEPPAAGNHFLTRVRQGLRRAQADVATRDTRIPLPAEAVMAIVADAESATDVSVLREDTAIALGSIFAGRQDSCVSLRSSDVGVDDMYIWLRLTEKGKRGQSVRRVVRLPIAARATHGHASALPRIAALLKGYRAARERAGSATEPEWFFQLPAERTRPTTRSMEGWLKNALERVHVRAPAGFAYLGHSIRSMGASSMAAIGVEPHLYRWIGGWQRGSVVVEKHYVDPTVLPTPAAYALYGWALTRQYTASAGVRVEAEVLPDPLEQE